MKTSELNELIKLDERFLLMPNLKELTSYEYDILKKIVRGKTK